MARANLPEPWLTAAQQRGIRGSLRALSEKTNLSHETVRRLVHGIGDAENATVVKVAHLLGVDAATIREWSGRPELSAPFVLPVRANQLNPDQRAAVLGVVAAFLGDPVTLRAKDGEGHGFQPAPIDIQYAVPIVDAEDLDVEFDVAIPRQGPSDREIAAVLNLRRVDHRITLAEVAEVAGVSADDLAQWFEGDLKLPGENVALIAVAVGTTYGEAHDEASRRAVREVRRHLDARRAGESAAG